MVGFVSRYIIEEAVRASGILLVVNKIHLPYSRKVWRIDSFQAFGERKFGELIDQPIDY